MKCSHPPRFFWTSPEIHGEFIYFTWNIRTSVCNAFVYSTILTLCWKSLLSHIMLSRDIPLFILSRTLLLCPTLLLFQLHLSHDHAHSSISMSKLIPEKEARVSIFFFPTQIVCRLLSRPPRPVNVATDYSLSHSMPTSGNPYSTKKWVQ